MSGCGNIINRKSTCDGLKTSSICIVYEGDLPDWSVLKNHIPGCVSIEETTNELYNAVSKLQELFLQYSFHYLNSNQSFFGRINQ